ncbi:hypothetical protein CI102_10773 [Trichoderma harzianum]|nr:hypothetical protein CI102_10773 [Trichoderma harzianum]
MPPLPASIGPFAPLHRGMIKCSGSYVFTPDGAMRAWPTWPTWVSATGRLIRSARGPANLRIGGLCWFRQCLGLDSLRLRGRGIGSANHVCNVAEPVLRVQLSRSPLAAQSYRLWIFPSVSAATTIINDELSIGSLVENFSTRHSIASLGLGLGMFVGQKAEMCRLMELGSNVGCTL